MRPTAPRSPWFALAAALSMALVLAAPIVAQEADPEPSPTPAADACVEPEPSLAPVTDAALSMPEDFRIELFDGVWEGIRDLYIDPDVRGLDWRWCDEDVRLLREEAAALLGADTKVTRPGSRFGGRGR